MYSVCDSNLDYGNIVLSVSSLFSFLILPCFGAAFWDYLGFKMIFDT